MKANSEFIGTTLKRLAIGYVSGAIIAVLGTIRKKLLWATCMGFGVRAAYFLLVALSYQRHVDQYSTDHEGVFWWLFIVGVAAGTAAGALGSAVGRFSATRFDLAKGRQNGE